MTTQFRRVYSAACLTVLLMFLFVCSAYGINLTDEERAYLRRKGSVVFVSQTRYPPFEFVDTEGQCEGMMLDVVRWLAVENRVPAGLHTHGFPGGSESGSLRQGGCPHQPLLQRQAE